LTKYHPAIKPEAPKPDRCTSLPESVVSDIDCKFHDGFNELRTNPATMVAVLDKILADESVVGE
jgi:hypothetical protein